MSRMGFHAYFFRMSSTIRKDSSIQKSKPIPGVTRSMFLNFIIFE